MSDQRTVPYGAAGIGVRTLRAEVVEGPDAGATTDAAVETLTIGSAPGNDLVLSDDTVSGYHVELSRKRGGVMVVDCGSTNGTHVGEVRIERGVVPADAILSLGKSRVRVGDSARVTLEVVEADSLAGLRGREPAMRRLMARIQKAAASDAPVLLLGESGTGKEVVARALRDLGARRDAPFVTVDCGALTPTLVASELFGHDRGAFTGAHRAHAGAFERAHGGTLFLDEIGELPGDLQTALLGALERKRIRRLGGASEIAIDVRVVAATHRDLRSEVNAGTFRLDLYYRLAVVMLKIPPLRERRDDIALLIEHFARTCGYEGAVDELFEPGVMKTLRAHHWPGNVRELRNLVEATIAMGEAPELSPHGLSESVDLVESMLERPYKEARSAVLADFESRFLGRILERAEGNVSRAAREARMDRSHLIDLLRRHGLR